MTQRALALGTALAQGNGVDRRMAASQAPAGSAEDRRRPTNSPTRSTCSRAAAATPPSSSPPPAPSSSTPSCPAGASRCSTRSRAITDKPVTMVINTHAHYDHTNGQVEFPASVEVVAHENTKTYMEQANPVYGLQTGPQPNIFKEHGGRGMAKRTFNDTLTLGSGADRIDLHYFGRAHTGGDTYVVFPALRRDARRRHVPERAICRSWTRTTAAAAWTSPPRWPRPRRSPASRPSSTATTRRR